MRNLYKSLASTLVLGLWAGSAAPAQLGVSYPGSAAPRTMLDVNGALAVALSSSAATAPTTAGQGRLTGTATGPVALRSASPPPWRGSGW